MAAEDSEAARGTQRSREEQAQLRTSTVAGDPRSRAGLSAAGVLGADAVILTGERGRGGRRGRRVMGGMNHGCGLNREQRAS